MMSGSNFNFATTSKGGEEGVRHNREGRFHTDFGLWGVVAKGLKGANSLAELVAYRATSQAKCSSSGAISLSQAKRTAAGDPGVEMTTFPP